MQRQPRSSFVWRFENEMAPSVSNYMPTTLVPGVELVQVTITMFLNSITVEGWFKFVDNSPTQRMLFNRGFFDGVQQAGTQLSDHGMFVNGSSVRLVYQFLVRSGQNFSETAVQEFVRFIRICGVTDEWKARYELPVPQVAQETMVEIHAKDHWVTYGQYLCQTGRQPELSSIL